MAHNKVQGTRPKGNKHKAGATDSHYTDQLASEKQNQQHDTDVNRNTANSEKRLAGFRTNERHFDLVVDGVPYVVRSIPFLFNDELRFRVILNEGEEHVFTWDSEINMLRAIDDESSVLPIGLEEALSERLQSQLK